MSNSLRRDIIECLHLLQIVPDFTQIVKTRRQFASKCPESPCNATQRLKSPLFATKSIQVNSKLSQNYFHRHKPSEFHFKTSIKCSQWSCLVTNSPRHVPKSSSKHHKQPLNVAYCFGIETNHHKMSPPQQNIAPLLILWHHRMSQPSLSCSETDSNHHKMVSTHQKCPFYSVVTPKTRRHSLSKIPSRVLFAFRPSHNCFESTPTRLDSSQIVTNHLNLVQKCSRPSQRCSNCPSLLPINW